MKKILNITIVFFLFTSAFAQLDSVIVEKYYVSNAIDAKDEQIRYDVNDNPIDTMRLTAGSVTYRVFIKMKKGCKLLKVYGDKNHALEISSTANFYNNIDYGKSLAGELSVNQLTKKTAALDTWLAFGSLGKDLKGKFAVPKAYDSDGSLLKNIVGGFLENNNSNAGIPLSVSDGFVNLKTKPLSTIYLGFDPKGNDSTIFGSVCTSNNFISHNAEIGVGHVGVMGIYPDNNCVLVAQLTTKGELSFKLNIEVIDSTYLTHTYVADTVVGDAAAKIQKSKWLTFPIVKKDLVCGCNDPNYIEYKPIRNCDSLQLCKTLRIFGCMDSDACNFDASANSTMPGMCCYPGNCNGRDLSEICSNIDQSFNVELFPNPATDNLNLTITSNTSIVGETKIAILNSFGTVISTQNMGNVNGTVNSQFDVNSYKSGMYFVRVQVGNVFDNKIFVKN